MRLIASCVLAACLLSGCVVTQTRDGNYNFGFVDVGQTTAEFPSASGPARVRRHMDGTYGLYFPSRMSQYRMGQFDHVTLVAHHSDGDRTAALLERRRGTCVSYELVTITANQVGRNPISTGCQTRLDAGVVDGRLVMRERVESSARLWVWSRDGMRSGREAPVPVATTPPPASRMSPRASTPAPARQTASTLPASRQVASTPARSTTSERAPPQLQLPPAGSISRTPEPMVTVVLDKD